MAIRTHLSSLLAQRQLEAAEVAKQLDIAESTTAKSFISSQTEKFA
jgi:DNA-binding Xre family transcriptional regulator